MIGEVHATNAALSSWHWNVAPPPASGDTNVNAAVVAPTAPLGPLTIWVSGVLVSIVQPNSAGVASTLPARSFARTENTWVPSPSGPNESPLLHGSSAPLSSEQPNVTVISSDVNSNTAITLLSDAGGAWTSIVSGATVSIDHRCSAGVGSELPVASTARTENTCVPSASMRANGELHGAAGSASIRHTKVAAASLDENRNAASAWLLNSGGASSIVVSSMPVDTGASIAASAGPASTCACFASTLQAAAAAAVIAIA